MSPTQLDHKNHRSGLPGASWVVTISVLLFLLRDQPSVQLIMAPLDLFTTFLHEMGHVIACLATGGTVHSMTILPGKELAGWTNCTGGDTFIIGQAGYLGATFFSCVLILVSRFWKMSNVILLLIGFFIGYCAPKLMTDHTAIIISMFLTMAFVIFAFQSSARDARLIVLFVALNVAFNSLMDVKQVTEASIGLTAAMSTDATAVAAVSPMSAKFWSSLWAVLSMLMVGFTGVLSYCMQHPHEEPASSPISSLLPLLKKLRDKRDAERAQAQSLLSKMQATVIETGPSINSQSRAPSTVETDQRHI
ncbi:MAG: M50 family metallopeptidase [Candidatus Obscuribacterales bacterium]